MGFGRTSSTSSAQVMARYMLGFKDGTANIKSENKKEVDEFVWVTKDDGPDWPVGGSYLMWRKINMRIETWDRESLEGQNSIIGRVKGSDGLGSCRRDCSSWPTSVIRKSSSSGCSARSRGYRNDLLNEYIVHVSSGIFACPPGIGKTGFWGETLFA